MARYIGPKTKIARKFKEPIFGPDKNFEKRNFPKALPLLEAYVNNSEKVSKEVHT